MKRNFAWLWAILALLTACGMALSIACGDDDDDDDDTEGDDDSEGDDDAADDDDDDDDDDDSTDDDSADDDDDDDDSAEITDFVLAFTNAKLKLDSTIEADQSFISVGGSIDITTIGQTSGSTLEASLNDVQFAEAQIDWATGKVGIISDGDTGFVGLSEINATIVAAKKDGGMDALFDYEASTKGSEVFNIDTFTPCAGATCNVAIYIGSYDVFSVNQFTDGYIGVTNDYILMWQFSGDAQNGESIDLTIDLE